VKRALPDTDTVKAAIDTVLTEAAARGGVWRAKGRWAWRAANYR
jgi:hypothetical protein